MNKTIHRSVICLLSVLCCQVVPDLFGQVAEKAPPTQTLEDWTGFKNPAPNWSIVGSVHSDRHKSRDLTTAPGSGILVSIPNKENAGDLWTEWQHGDLWIEFDVMMPTGSNSGVYLQGRY